MEVEKKKEGNATVVTLKGRMDAVSAPTFDQALGEVMAAGDSIIVLDFSGLEYISSAGLRSILVLARQIKEMQGKVMLAGLKNTVRDVFKMSGFYSIFAVFETVKEAVSSS